MHVHLFEQVTYNYKIKLTKETGEPVNSHCECPAGKGPHGTCKHIAAVLLMLVEFVESGQIDVERSCTDNLQTFHKPKNAYNGKIFTYCRLQFLSRLRI